MIEPSEGCICSCCAEARNRLAHGRDLDHACTCAGHPEAERCDCTYCVAVAAGGIGEHAVLVVLEDGSRFHTPHALVDGEGSVLPMEPFTDVSEAR